MIWLLYIWMIFSGGAAAPLYYEAQNLDIFVKSLEEDGQIVEKKRKCSQEFQRAIFPQTCLQILDLEIDDLESSFSGLPMFSQLSNLCLVGEGLQEISLDRGIELLQLESLPPACRKRLKNQIEDLRYLEESTIGPNLEISVGHGDFKSRASSI